MFTMKIAKQCLVEYIYEDIAVMLSGVPGVGKSEVVYEVGDEIDYKVIDMRVSRMDPVDLHGLPVTTGKTTDWLPPDALPNVKRDGPKGLLFLDELTQASQAMQSACFGLVLERRLGSYVLPKGWVPIAAGNRLMDRAGVQRMPTPLRNRFAHMEIGVDLESWCEWANVKKLSPILIGFIRFREELLHKMPQGEENSFPTPRAWAKVARLVDKSEKIRQYLVQGLVGEGPAQEFEAFARTWARLPSIKEILANPKKAPVPPADEPGVYYALSAALSRRATQDNFAAVIEYVARLPKEFSVFTVTDAVRHDAKLAKTRAYANWIVDHQDITL